MTKPQVIAFEGGHPTATLSWGVAALRFNDELLNPVTGLSIPYTEDELEKLSTSGALTRVNPPIPVARKAVERAPYVVMLRGPEFRSLLDPMTVRGAHAVAHQPSGDDAIWIFAAEEIFQRYREAVLDRLMRRLLQAHRPEDVDPAILRLAQTLDAHDPAVNALSVFCSGGGQIDRLIAESSLRSEPDKHRFGLLIRAFTQRHVEYFLKYESGIASGGGLDVDSAVVVLQAMNDTHEPIAQYIEQEFPFLDAAPGNRMEELKAASASFKFVNEPTQGDYSIGERAARYLELFFLQQCLDGIPVPELAESPALRHGVNVLSKPSPETVVYHQPFDSEELKHVRDPDAPDEDLDPGKLAWQHPHVVLAYQSGLLDDGKIVEIHYGAGAPLRMPGDDNGVGERPVGLDTNKPKDFLCRPGLYTIQRRLRGKSVRTFLQKVQWLDPNQSGVVTAIPSGIVPGALIVRETSVRRDGSQILRLDDEEIPGLNTSSLTGARKWMDAYVQLCFAREMEDLRPVRIPPVLMPPRPLLLSVLTELQAQPGSLFAIGERLGLRAPRDLRRLSAVIDTAASAGYVSEEEESLQILLRGRRYLAAYNAIARRALSEE